MRPYVRGVCETKFPIANELWEWSRWIVKLRSDERLRW